MFILQKKEKQSSGNTRNALSAFEGRWRKNNRRNAAMPASAGGRSASHHHHYLHHSAGVAVVNEIAKTEVPEVS